MISALASALVPGWGQLRNGHRRKGWIMLAIAGALAAMAGFLVWRRPLTLLTWGVQPTALGWLLIGNGALFGFRAYAAADALVHSRARATARPWHRVGGAAIGLAAAGALVFPHAVSGYGMILDKDLLTSVFAPAPTVAPPTTLAPVTSPPASSAAGNPSSIPPPTTTTTTIPARLWDGTDRLNVLLLGGDAGIGRSGIRTDTILVASVDPESGDVGLFGVPRNMARVPLPESLDIWACDCFPAIINELWDYGERNPARFVGARPPGAAALTLAVEELLGIPIHHFALVNLDGFVDLIDAIGGVDVVVTERIYDSAYPHEDGSTEVIDLAPGEYKMDGHLALAYARTRRASDDYTRMGRQRCLLQAVADQADPISVARSFANITNTIKNNLLTDIPLERLPDLIQLIPKLDPERIVSVGLIPPRYSAGRTAELYPTPAVSTIREAVSTVLELPPAQAIAALGLEPFTEECG